MSSSLSPMEARKKAAAGKPDERSAAAQAGAGGQQAGEAGTEKPVTIVIADDHAVVRAGLRMLLERGGGFEVVAEAGDVPSGPALRARPPPDVLVLDLNMPGEPSLAGDPALREEAPETQIVVLTMQEDPAFAREALRAGALGYVLKEAADDELVEAVRLRGRGRHLPQPAARRAARGRAAEPRAAGRPHRARGRDPAADRPRPHQRRDRRAALPQRAHRRVAPRAHPAEARPLAPAPSWSATRSTTGCSRR